MNFNIHKISTALVLFASMSIVAMSATQLDLTTQVRGVLPVANGGTGAASGVIAFASGISASTGTFSGNVTVNGATLAASAVTGTTGAYSGALSGSTIGVVSAVGVSHAVCWTASSVIGYCSDVVSASGVCTCH